MIKRIKNKEVFIMINIVIIGVGGGGKETFKFHNEFGN